MTAITKNKFRFLNSQNLIDKITAGADYLYAFIGKNDTWNTAVDATTDLTPDVPIDSQYYTYQLHDNMAAIKQIATDSVSLMVPRVDWVSGTSYVAWDDADESIYNKNFYVVTDEFKVYKCIRSGTDANGAITNVSVKPTHVTNDVYVGSDNYAWQYLYSISASDANKFYTNNYMPVSFATSGQQQTDQNAAKAATSGKIYRIIVTNGGTGYNVGTTTVTIDGDGTGATGANVTVKHSGGVITAIEMPVSANAFTSDVGNGDYTHATVTISNDSGGTGATARVVVSDIELGHGGNPVYDLGGFYVGVNALLDTDEGGTFNTSSSFRQLGLLWNPTTDGTTLLNQPSFNTLRTLTLAGDQTAVITPGDVIEGQTTNAIAYVDDVTFSTPNTIIEYHQNNKTGFEEFDDTTPESIDLYAGTYGSSIAIIAASKTDPAYARYTGDILFYENRTPVLRNSSQIEDLKIIVEF